MGYLMRLLRGLLMTRRLIDTIGTIKVYYCSHYDEYTCVNPAYPVGHDARECFEYSLSDARDTAKAMNEEHQKNVIEEHYDNYA